MNYIRTTISKPIILFYACIPLYTLSVCAMDPIIITIHNHINNRDSSVQLCYTHLHNYGVNTILNAPNIIKCFTQHKGYILTESTDGIVDKAKRFASLRLSDPRSKEKQLELEITKGKVVIHNFDPQTKKIIVTKEEKEIAFFSYPEK
ncbi:MAG TPA: hypothetical protein VKU36_00180 [Candidatus Babeliales bacterium]|nr:hypothetical protein [Candidatus Babeliales bacterium]